MNRTCLLLCLWFLSCPASLFAWEGSSIHPYIAVGGLFGEMDDCSLGHSHANEPSVCEEALGVEVGAGGQAHYVRGELFYSFGILKTRDSEITIDNFTFEGVTEAERHVVAVLGVLEIPYGGALPHVGASLNFIGPFVGVGLGYTWQSTKVSAVESEASGQPMVLLEKGRTSSFLVIVTAGIESQVHVGDGHTISLEAGYRYHHTSEPEEVDRAHLGVVRLRYGF